MRNGIKGLLAVALVGLVLAGCAAVLGRIPPATQEECSFWRGEVIRIQNLSLERPLFPEESALLLWYTGRLAVGCSVIFDELTEWTRNPTAPLVLER